FQPSPPPPSFPSFLSLLGGATRLGRLSSVSLHERCTSDLCVLSSALSQQVVDEMGNVKFCLDEGSDPGGSWLKYVHTAISNEEQNMAACHLSGDQIDYKAIRDIKVGEELLVYMKEGIFPEGSMALNLEDEQMYRCEDCDELFTSALELQRHQKCFCSSAGSVFDTLSNEDFKQGCDDSDHESVHECKDCEKIFPDEYSLGQHMIVHTEEREYKCDQCPKAFNWKSNLIRHQMSHDSGKQFECQNCDKVFTDPSNLQRHIRSQHIGARTHTCPECGKTFATSSGLKQHKHIHSSVKPFICEVCHKSYTQFSNLCRHKRMHADCRTQIKCKDCGQMFSTTSSLNKHQRFCEGKNPGIPMSNPILAKSRSHPHHHHPGLNHSGLAFPDYFPSRPHLHASLSFSPRPHGFPSLSHGFPDLFVPSLYPRPPLLPPSPFLKSSLGKNSNNGGSQEGKLPHSPLDGTPLSLINSIKNNNGGNSLLSSQEREDKERLELAYREVKAKAKMSEVSDGSDLEEVNATSGTDLDTTTGTALCSELDSDAESDSSSVSAVSSSFNLACEQPPFLSVASQHSFFPHPDEQALPPTGATAATDSIKAIASIAEKYFGPALMGLQEKNMGSMPCHSMFPFQFLPNFPHSLYPFTERAGALKPGMFFKAEPKSPRVQHPPPHKMAVPRTEEPSPFDLTTKPKKTKPKLPAPAKLTPPSGSSNTPLLLLGDEEQPLDLSISSHRWDVHNGVVHQQPLAQPPQQQPSLHYIKPSAFFMDPIYSRVEKRKLLDPVGALKEKFLRANSLLFHPQMSAMESMTEKLESFGTLKLDASPNLLQHSAHPLFNVRSPPSLSAALHLHRNFRSYCGKIFPRSANLTRHLRTHTGEQPYSQHSGILSNLGNNISSPNSEPDHHALLDEKEDSYFSEIHNFISNSEMNQASSSTDKSPQCPLLYSACSQRLTSTEINCPGCSAITKARFTRASGLLSSPLQTKASPAYSLWPCSFR
uniref:C2H2-type domain-containing protein n=1 Tax=Oncorhynchus tshawytscha TaxID=74940 RepID=A0AAZ3Q9C0_ONCTS